MRYSVCIINQFLWKLGQFAITAPSVIQVSLGVLKHETGRFLEKDKTHPPEKIDGMKMVDVLMG